MCFLFGRVQFWQKREGEKITKNNLHGVKQRPIFMERSRSLMEQFALLVKRRPYPWNISP
jgi:hypothetical protein